MPRQIIQSDGIFFCKKCQAFFEKNLKRFQNDEKTSVWLEYFLETTQAYPYCESGCPHKYHWIFREGVKRQKKLKSGYLK